MYEKKSETEVGQYVQLRTMLDSLQIGALRYYLNATGQEEQQKHFEYLTNQMEPIIEQIWKSSATAKESQGSCPDGYVDCYGCCVPYNCFF